MLLAQAMGLLDKNGKLSNNYVPGDFAKPLPLRRYSLPPH